MSKTMAHEPTNHETRHETQTRPEQSSVRRKTDNTPTECGLTREELRALVVEMIG